MSPGRGLFAVMLGASVERQAVRPGSDPTHKKVEGLVSDGSAFMTLRSRREYIKPLAPSINAMRAIE
ncbi:hypothetical protein PSPTOT1_5281 [Pseudomonas syringae pv. tomato T1]|nr:hypothetical protein PSPTOT1_5281 [Pseudomonas syringae pv. tomato T1]